jgi:hypothetical protein
METVTIACPPGYTDPNVNAETAPIWLDSNGIEYLIASGPIEGYATSDPIQATTIRVSVVVGMDGLDALAAMGLTVKEIEV